MSAQDPTADYRKYPKGPNFLAVVIAFCAVILLVIIAALIFLKRDAAKAVPHSPTATPNSLVQPLPVKPLLPTLAPHVA